MWVPSPTAAGDLEHGPRSQGRALTAPATPANTTHHEGEKTLPRNWGVISKRRRNGCREATKYQIPITQGIQNKCNLVQVSASSWPLNSPAALGKALPPLWRYPGLNVLFLKVFRILISNISRGLTPQRLK